MLLVVLHDPSSDPTFLNMDAWRSFKRQHKREALSLDPYFESLWDQYRTALKAIRSLWGQSARKTEEGPESDNINNTISTRTQESRTNLDKDAQKNIPKRYGGRCVLSDSVGAQGAHIVPVRTLGKAKDKRYRSFSHHLSMFWPGNCWDVVSSDTYNANILPLEVGVHSKWDRYLPGQSGVLVSWLSCCRLCCQTRAQNVR